MKRVITSLVLFSAILLGPSRGHAQQYSFQSQRWCEGSEAFGADCFLRYEYHTITLDPIMLTIRSMNGSTEYPLVRQLMAVEMEDYFEVHYLSNVDIQLWVRVYKQPLEAEGYTYQSELMVIDLGVVRKYFIEKRLNDF